MSDRAVWTCDRCGATDESPGREHAPHGWRSLSWGQAFIYPADPSGDLCPTCMEWLREWWKAGKA